MSIIQIAILAFVLYALYRLIERLRSHEITTMAFVAWLILWLLIGIFAVIPDSLSYISTKVGVGRGVDMAIYFSLLILFYLVFRILSRLEKMDKNFSELVRKVSLEKTKIEHNNKKEKL